MRSNLFNALRKDSSLIRTILNNPHDFDDWTLQGFGMLRLYLTKAIRLHLWHSEFAVADVSLLHDHPWDFESYIVSGRLVNYRYAEVLHNGSPWQYSKIKCGAGGGMRSDPERVLLVESSPEILVGGNIYNQRSDEIHKSIPDDGTVTLIEREFKPDTEHARVFWPVGQDWVSAEPRPAAAWEINSFCQAALKKFP